MGAAGSMVTSGINWAHDKDIIDQSGDVSRQLNNQDWSNKTKYAGVEYGYNSAMSEQKFHQDQQNEGLSIMGNLANTATGGIFGLAGDVVSGGMQMWNNSKQFGYNQALSNQTFTQNKALSAQNYTQQYKLNKQNIIGNIANTVTGGTLGAISSGIHDAVGIYQQHSDQDFQKQQLTRNFNNTIQANETSAPALKIAT